MIIVCDLEVYVAPNGFADGQRYPFIEFARL